MSGRITTAFGQAANALNIGIAERTHAIEPRPITASQHDAANTAADNDRAVRGLGPIALFHRCVKGVAIDMSDRQVVQLRVADEPRRAARSATFLDAGRWPKRSAIAAERAHCVSFNGHSHAAPRTPLEAPWTGGRRRVATRSEKTYCAHSLGTPS
jgi:hypothetical protein